METKPIDLEDIIEEVDGESETSVTASIKKKSNKKLKSGQTGDFAIVVEQSNRVSELSQSPSNSQLDSNGLGGLK